MLLHDERVTYETIKSWALETYFRGCRDNALMKGWPHEQIIGYVSYQFETTFERPVEILMWNVVLLVLSGGWHEIPEQNIRKNIAAIVIEYGLETLLTNVPVKEAELLRHDLKILKLI